MLMNSRKQEGSALVVVIVIIAVAVLGTLGYVVWNNFIAPKNAPSEEQKAQTKDGCESDAVEKSGTFCSEDVGIEFKIPTVFEGKIKQTDNYEVFKGTVDYTTRTSAGNSEVVYSAVITGTDEFTLSIAKEPLRSGYVDVGHMLQGTYYDVQTGLLSNVTSPTYEYDSTTDTTITTGEYSVGETVPSFTAQGMKVYKGIIGDAGTRIETYFIVINESIVKITLNHGAFMGPQEDDPSTIDADEVFSELDAAIKDLKLVR